MPLERVAELLRLLQSAREGAAPQGDARPTQDETVARARYGDLVLLASQIMLACAASGLRSWGRTAEIWGGAIPLIAETLAGANGRLTSDPEGMGRALDGVRTVLRELAEVPGQESRRLQVELERIVLTLGSGPGQAGRTESEPYWRRWEAKP